MTTSTPLQWLRAAAERSTPLVSIAGNLGIVLESVDEGALVARLPALPPTAVRGPGAALVLADMVLTATVASALSQHAVVSTLTVHWAGVGRFPAPGTELVATGTALRIGDGSGLCTGLLTDGDGEVLATLSGRCAVLPLTRPLPQDQPRPDRPAGPDRGAPTGPTGLDTMQLAGGAGSWRAVGDPALHNAVSGVQGGVLAALAAHAMDDVIGAARPHLAGAAADLDVTFLRPVAADGSTFTATAEAVRTGSRLAAARATVLDSAGRPAVVASATHWHGGQLPGQASA